MFKKKFIHPKTGDSLTFSEQISWMVQNLIRTWYFVVLWTATTIVWWIKPSWFGDTSAYIKWMNLASWLAVTVELVIGIAMIGQTTRDALILREIRKLERNQTDDLRDLIDSLEDYE